MAGRVTQKPIEAVYTPDGPKVRVTQKPIEAVYTPTDRRVRVTHRVIEVAYAEFRGGGDQIIWID